MHFVNIIRGRRKTHVDVRLEDLKEVDCLEDLGVDERIILK
jgi:hypothetical protein